VLAPYRTGAGRLAPLLLGSAHALCRALGVASTGNPRLSEWLSTGTAEALREALGVLRDWLTAAKDLPQDQLEKVRQVGLGCRALVWRHRQGAAAPMADSGGARQSGAWGAPGEDSSLGRPW
jgi:hypothetical protein